MLCHNVSQLYYALHFSFNNSIMYFSSVKEIFILFSCLNFASYTLFVTLQKWHKVDCPRLINLAKRIVSYSMTSILSFHSRQLIFLESSSWWCCGASALNSLFLSLSSFSSFPLSLSFSAVSLSLSCLSLFLSIFSSFPLSLFSSLLLFLITYFKFDQLVAQRAFQGKFIAPFEIRNPELDQAYINLQAIQSQQTRSLSRYYNPHLINRKKHFQQLSKIKKL